MTASFPHQLILGHRGSPRQATENTLRSLAIALEEGADGVELDIQRSSDGVPVVIHDDALDRTTGIAGRISRLPWPAIERLTSASVPSFDQVSAWAAASGAWLNVEMKAPRAEEEVIAAIERTGIRERVFISSFIPSIVRRIGEIEPGIRRFLLTDHWDAAAEKSFAEATAHGVCLRDSAASEPVLRDLADRGIPVVVWTVNDPARVRQLLDRGVAGLISDYPDMAAHQRAIRGS